MNKSAHQKTNKCHEEVSTQKQEPETNIYNICFATSINMGGTNSISSRTL